MAVLLGLASALVYGAADFLGGLTSKRSSAYAVVVWSQLAGLAALALAIVVLREPLAAPVDLGWGALGGIGGGTGVVLLYRGLALGRMSIVAPTTAVGAASIPVLVGIALGERPGPLPLVGVVIALVAIVLISADGAEQASQRRRLPPGLAEAMGAGLGFALFFVCLANTSPGADLWPLLVARVSVGVAALAGLATRSPLLPATGSWRRIVVVGLLDMTANLLYVLASRRGLLSIVAVLVSLYPASTVLLARVVLGERLSGKQLSGLLTAGVGVVLIAAA